jgi:hypothetical protein
MKIVEIPVDPHLINVGSWKDDDYPNYIYDYSTDDTNHYEYQQNLALTASYGE